LRLHNLLFVPGSLLLLAAMQVVAQCFCQPFFPRSPLCSLCGGQVWKIFHVSMQRARDELVKKLIACNRCRTALGKPPAALPNLTPWYIRLGSAMLP